MATKRRLGQMASVPSIILKLSLHIKVFQPCIIELTSVFGTQPDPFFPEKTTDRATERAGPKAPQQLWVHAVGLASRAAARARTELMKKQQWAKAGVELEHHARCTTAPVATGRGHSASCRRLNPAC